MRISKLNEPLSEHRTLVEDKHKITLFLYHGLRIKFIALQLLDFGRDHQ